MNASPGSTFAPLRIATATAADGGMLMYSDDELRLGDDTLPTILRRRAGEHPDRVLLAERAAAGWATLTYGEAWRQACIVARALLERGASVERPVALLAENGIGHALMALGAMVAGVPVSPVSTSYSKLSSDFAKLKYVLTELTPSVLYVDDAQVHAKALAHLDLSSVAVVAGVAGESGHAALSDVLGGTAIAELPPVGLDTVAKVLFTSGSTALPKGVIQTQRMMLANQQAIAQAWPFLQAGPPVLVDWLPWNHVFGGNQNFNMALVNGGSLYVDPGRPVANGIALTAAALREVAPTVYFNVPRGFDMLIPLLEQDEALGRHFFSRLRLIGYAGAALTEALWRRLEALSEQFTGQRVPMAALWGSTETSPVATLVQFETRSPGNIGVPVPGCMLKLLPDNGKLEVRVKGPCIMPGYWRHPELTAAAFDDDGFYKIGDALRLADPHDPCKGLLFDGRTGENFKLSSGTWVNVGPLRVAAVEAGLELIVAGHNRDYVGLLVFPKLAACRALVDDAGEMDTCDLLTHHRVATELRAVVERLNASSSGSSTRVRRALLLEEPPSADANEITDKGYINQRAVLDRRAHLVEALFADQPDTRVVTV
jgi:feruloyl-CoA synthase